MLSSIRLLQILVIAATAAGAAIAAPVPAGRNDPKIADFDEAKPAEGDARASRQQVRTSINNIKQIALSVHNYADTFGGKLPQNVVKDDKPLLSWRVLLLPYLEQEALYKQFKLDEPWDSPNNLKLLEKIPAVYESPRVKTKKGYTVYQGFRGNGAVIGSGLGIAQIADGTSNTILCVDATRAAPWTKPTDIPFDPMKDLPKFGKAFGEKPLAALCDGSVRELDLNTISAATLKNAINTNDGIPLGPDW
jgi:hypothetical protein